ILGIFASIVLAFTGGIAFSTSVLQNISNVSIYRLTMIVICLACVLMNVIYLLVWFIKGLIKKEGDIVQYPKFMKVFNLSCLIAIMLTIVAWWFDLKYLAKIFRIWLYKI
ncbi:MAG: hypothetical protein SO101_14410, partial [Lachnospiraceae bacterium]|nr:hypothetical protein [Lachnospiraceae bacterium]